MKTDLPEQKSETNSPSQKEVFLAKMKKTVAMLEAIEHDFEDINVSLLDSMVWIRSIKNNEDLDDLLMAITGVFGEGTRKPYGPRMVEYTFEKDGIKIEVDVMAEVAGCKLEVEEVWVPRKVFEIEGHTKKQYRVICEEKSS